MDAEDQIEETENPKKRRSYGRLTAASKRLKAQSFELGESCLCKRFKCFENIPPVEQKRILDNFNTIGATSPEPWNSQSSYLAGLISVLPVKRRRSRKADPADARGHQCTFSYRVRVNWPNEIKDVEVCKKAFISLHGITKRRLNTIQESLKGFGVSPKDKRGSHKNRPHKLTPEKINSVCDHIKSFKGKISHYSNTKSKKMYLPEDLTIKKMHVMYKQYCTENNMINNYVSYESYRNIFNKRFNVSFGYPRSDTCSTCDIHTVKCNELLTKIKTMANGEEKTKIEADLKKRLILKKLHLKKAETFYKRKKLYRKESVSNKSMAVVCMDFQRNLDLPNISTNDAYYRRKLAFYMFNVHELASSNSVFYCYTEAIGGKGSNEVVSFIDNFINFKLDSEVKELFIFCDSCTGQNKNYNFFRYIYFMVHIVKRLEKIHVTFPIRGHSYMESDRNMAIIKTKSRAEVPQDWIDVVEVSRQHPTPFIAVDVDQCLIRDWTGFLEGHFIKKCPFPTRPIRELLATSTEPHKLLHRDTYNGCWLSSEIALPNSNTFQEQPLQVNEFFLPPRAYAGMLAITNAKYTDVNHLAQFCTNLIAPDYYLNLAKGKVLKKRKQ